MSCGRRELWRPDLVWWPGHRWTFLVCMTRRKKKANVTPQKVSYFVIGNFDFDEDNLTHRLKS